MHTVTKFIAVTQCARMFVFKCFGMLLLVFFLLPLDLCHFVCATQGSTTRQRSPGYFLDGGVARERHVLA